MAILIAGLYLVANFVFAISLISIPKPKTDSYDEFKKAEILKKFCKSLFYKFLIINIPASFAPVLGALTYMTRNTNISDAFFELLKSYVILCAIAYVGILQVYDKFSPDIYYVKDDGSVYFRKKNIFIFALDFIIWLAFALVVIKDYFLG